MKELKKILGFSIITFFVLLGVILFTTIIHETFHYIHSDGKANAVCLASGVTINDDLQQGSLLGFTSFDLSKYENVSTYNDWRELTEKYASILNLILLMITPLTLGIIGGIMYGRHRNS